MSTLTRHLPTVARYALGAGFLLWSSLSFFSVLESAFNIVYGRPNRGWLHGKALATMMMVGSLVSLFLSLVVGSIGQEILKRYAGFAGNATTARVIAIRHHAGLGIMRFVNPLMRNPNITSRTPYRMANQPMTQTTASAPAGCTNPSPSRWRESRAR